MSRRKPQRGGGHSFTVPEEVLWKLEPEVEAVDFKPPADYNNDAGSDDEEEENDKASRPNGVSHLIEVYNPNRDSNAAQREPRNRATPEAQADLERDMARLRIIRRKRETAERNMAQQKEASEAAHAAAQARAQERLEALKNRGKGGRKPGAKVGKQRQPPPQSAGPEVAAPAEGGTTSSPSSSPGANPSP